MEDYPASYDQTTDNANNLRGGLPGTDGITPYNYRSPQVDEEEFSGEHGKMKGALREIIDSIQNKETIGRAEINKIASHLEQIIKQF